MVGLRRIDRRSFLGAVAAGAVVSAVASCASAGPPQGQQHGYALPTWEQHGYRDFDTFSALRAMRATGAAWVQIVPTWYQARATATDIRPTAGSSDPDDVRLAITLAHRAGLRVLLKPHVDVLDGDDRSRIAPTDSAAWFGSYRSFIGLWAGLADDEDVEEFCVGTELRSMAGERGPWLDVISGVRRAYSGPLVYAANDDAYRAVSFWDAVDLAGIDGYWALATRPTVDGAQLRRALEAKRTELARFAQQTGRRVLFTEAGFPSQSGAAVAPWNDRQSAVPAPDEQAAAYRALLSAFDGAPWWAGVFWWTWTVPHRYALDTPLALDHSVSGKPAADVVREAWT
jgi:hypothetical protein